MKIIVIATAGKLDFYLEDLGECIAEAGGHDVQFCALSSMNRRALSTFFLPPEERRLGALRKLVEKERPDVLFFNSYKLRFDFQEVRRFFHGKIIVLDMEGPNFAGFHAPDWIRHVNLVITVSRLSCRILNDQGFKNVVYLPHGVNPSRFFPTDKSASNSRNERIFIGRPSPHRNQYLEKLMEIGLPVTLYGKKWHDSKQAPISLAGCAARRKEDIHGTVLLETIEGADLFVNILQDQFKDLQTLINMQVFMVSACRTCVLTEYVEEIADAFEPETEISVYRDIGELCEKALYFHKNPQSAEKIAVAAYKRVLQDHTLEKRAGALCALLKSS
jgi:glycosyltransferase involved in cell wall biosynthesis